MLVVRPNLADYFARAERNADHVARHQFLVIGNAVGIGLIERHRDENIDNSSGHEGIWCGDLRKDKRPGVSIATARRPPSRRLPSSLILCLTAAVAQSQTRS